MHARSLSLLHSLSCTLSQLVGMRLSLRENIVCIEITIKDNLIQISNRFLHFSRLTAENGSQREVQKMGEIVGCAIPLSILYIRNARAITRVTPINI